MEDFKELLTIKPREENTLKNKLKVWMKWDSNDGDYIERTVKMYPEDLFDNKKLIYCLAYITCNYNIKGCDWNGEGFNRYIPDNTDIDDLGKILSENCFAVYSDWGMCHSCEGLEITYYDENGKPWDISFDDIHKEWENMSYEEICEQINNIEENDKRTV